jgi:group I intron endonuclease
MAIMYLGMDLEKLSELIEIINDNKDFPIFRGTSGIYAIHNLANRKTYFGKSSNIRDRLIQHRNKLRHRRHDNEMMQKDYLKYGEENFIACAVQECSKKNLSTVEKMFIDRFQTTKRLVGYNIRKG